MDRITSGDPKQSPVLPRMVNEMNFKRVLALIDPQKVVKGGASNLEELYIEPTIMDRVTPDDPVMQEEVFGPLLPVLTYRDLDDLLDTMKKGPAPLALYIFTSRRKLAVKIMKTVASGGGMINEVVMHFINMNAPFGGMGASGMGSYHGRAGFNDFSHHKTIMVKPTWFELFLKYPPHRKFYLRIYRSLLGRSVRNFWR
jgi:aldehyde dehydrogenase (NAD+)